MPGYAYWTIAAGTILWCLPFPLNRTKGGNILDLDKRARWGVILECLGYSLLWQGSFWLRTPASWRLAASITFFTLAVLLSWTGARALGKHLRVEAAIGQDHELVRSGPYRILRHPIYTSMLCVLLGTGLLIASNGLLVAGIAVFLIGTEIRVHVEDALLGSRFGGAFEDYRRTVRAYVPFIR